MAMISVRLPKSAEYDPNAAVGLVDSIYKSYPDGLIIFSIVGWADGTWWTIEILGYDDSFNAETASTIIHSYYPMAEISDCYDILPEKAPSHMIKAFFEVDMNQWFYFPTKTAYDLKSANDPLSALTVALDDVREGEVFGYTLLPVGDSVLPAEQIDQLMLQTRGERTDYIQPHQTSGFVDTIFEAQRLRKAYNQLVPRYNQTDERVFRAKLSQHLYMNTVCVYAYGPELERLKQKIQVLSTPIFQVCLPSIHRFSQVASESVFCKTDDEVFQALPFFRVKGLVNEPDPPAPKKKNEPPKYRRIDHLAVNMTSAEVAAFWHLPHKNLEGDRINWLKSAQVPLSQAMKAMTPQEGVLMGVNRIGGQATPVYLPNDGRDRHALIIGKSGTGKSSLVHRLIHEDIAMGRGVCVLDPHGDLVADVLRSSIPPEREDEVVVLDVSSKLDKIYYPPPLNPLARTVDSENEDLRFGAVVIRLMNVFEKAYPGFMDTQMGYYLKNCILTLEHEGNPTLFDVQRLFRDPHYRARMVDKVTTLSTRNFWQSFSKQSATNLEKAWFPLERRLSGFFDSNEMLAISCHPKPLPLSELMSQNKIILVSLTKRGGILGDAEQRLLGAAVVAQVQMAAMSGAITQKPFMLYIDEAQNFVTSALPEILSQARKYGLALHLANQYFQQLAGDTLAAVEGNIGTIFAFEVGEGDARDLGAFMKSKFETDDLVQMGNFKAAVTTRYRGERQPPFSLETLTPPTHDLLPQELEENERRIRAKSIKNYTPLNQEEVMAAITKKFDELPVNVDDNEDFYEQPPTDQPKEE